jgi:hypothetical protein
MKQHACDNLKYKHILVAGQSQNFQGKVTYSNQT